MSDLSMKMVGANELKRTTTTLLNLMLRVGPLAVKRRKLTPSQISGMCGDEDLDPSLDKNRKKVGKMHEKNILQD
jgi:hypothetical protein